MSETKHIVYLATNVANGKRYVGYTSKGLVKRKQQHIAHACGNEKRTTRFAAALRKYGADAFVWEVLAVFDTRHEGLAEEIRLISELRPEYNVTSGGDGTTGIPAWNRKPVTCLSDGRMFVSATAAAAHYGLDAVSVGAAARGVRETAGARYFVYGDVEYSAEERDKIIAQIKHARANNRRRVAHRSQYGSAASGVDAKGRRATGPLKNSRAVVCLDDNKKYVSASEAARAYDVSRSAVIEMCLGKPNRKTVGGLRFAYVEKVL